jgi:hypothetical protein
MKTTIKIGMSVLAVSLFAGCASGPSSEDILKEQLRLAEMRADAVETAKELQEEKLEEKLDDVPDWYLNPPHSDTTV